MSSWGEQKKAWTREWALMRRDFLDGRLLDVMVVPAPEGVGVRWECPICGDVGSEITSEKLAQTAGRGHMQTHVSAEDHEALERMKVLRMPEILLSPYQRSMREALEAKHE